MSRIKDVQSEVLGTIASIQTLLNNYPSLTSVDSLLDDIEINTSMNFMLNLLKMFGITKTDLVLWVSNLLSDDKDGSGFLNALEQAVKGILLVNVKGLMTCAINPFLPDSLMKYSYANGKKDPCNSVTEKRKKKIEIDLNQIDLFGILNNCPSDLDGSIFYFDSYDSILDNEEASDPSKNANFKGSAESLKKIKEQYPEREIGDIYKVTGSIDKYYIWSGTAFLRYGGSAAYGPNDLWKSCDFNAYLWYIINKGTTTNNTDLQKSTWDNRNKCIKQLKKDQTLRRNFFNTDIPEKYDNKRAIPITGSSETAEKKQILICEFNERVTPSTNETSLPSSNVLRVWINANRYYRTTKVKTKDGNTLLSFNKTIFEFNYDYIYSLKLFDSKVIIANIVNALLGLTDVSLGINASLKIKQAEAVIGSIVKKIIQEDDTQTTDCYYTFSNEEYDKLLQESLEKYDGTYKENNYGIANLDTNSIMESLRGISQNTTQHSKTETISNTLEDIMATAAQNASVSEEIKFSFGFNFIQDFIKELMVQIIMSILSPKVAILFIINSIVMGSDTSQIKSWEDFIKNYQNVITNIIREVKDLLLQQLYEFVMKYLKEILELFISKLALETIQYYIDLIKQLIKYCMININFSITKANTVIDNVNYADIIPTKTENTDDTTHC